MASYSFNAARSTILILSSGIENGLDIHLQGLCLLIKLNLAAVELGPSVGGIVDGSPPYTPIP